MNLLDRDRKILTLLGDFSLLTERQIRELLFADNSSATPTHRALRRLLASRLITRLDIRLVGERGGAGEYIYKLSPNGLRLCPPSTRHREKIGNYAHSLAIADVAVDLAKLQRSGAFTIKRLELEPDSWRTIAGVELRPDMRVDIERTSERQYFVELDLSTERSRHLTAKLDAYRQAWDGADVTKLRVFPLVVWVVPDTARQRFLERLVERQPEQARQLFRVTTSEGLAEALTV